MEYLNTRFRLLNQIYDVGYSVNLKKSIFNFILFNAFISYLKYITHIKSPWCKLFFNIIKQNACINWNHLYGAVLLMKNTTSRRTLTFRYWLKKYKSLFSTCNSHGNCHTVIFLILMKKYKKTVVVESFYGVVWDVVRKKKKDRGQSWCPWANLSRLQSHSEIWNIQYFYFFALVTKQSVALSSINQLAMPLEFGEMWETEVS